MITPLPLSSAVGDRVYLLAQPFVAVGVGFRSEVTQAAIPNQTFRPGEIGAKRLVNRLADCFS